MLRNVSFFATFTLIVGCAGESDEHDMMPEPSAAIEQLVEDGPVGEGIFSKMQVAEFAVEEGFFVSQEIDLLGEGSRATVWVSLTDAAAVTPSVFVQAGWSSNQSGPWVALNEVWNEEGQRILSANLETAATRLRIRIDSIDALSVLRWGTNIPLKADLRSASLPPPLVPNGLTAKGPADWSAQNAQCGSDNAGVTELMIYRLPAKPAGISDELYLRAAQAFDQQGRQFCDLRLNYVVGAQDVWMARGPRVGARADVAAHNVRRVSLAVIGCDANEGVVEQLNVALTELTNVHGFTAETQFAIGTSPNCDTGSTWLYAALDTWLMTAPFVEPVEPPPPPDAMVTGRVFDSSTGDETTGVGITGATVTCDCGPSVSTGPSGAYTLMLPVGTHTLTVTKTDFIEAQTTVTMTGTQQTVSIGMEPEMSGPPPPDLVSEIDHELLIERFGGTVVDPINYPKTQAGFDAYLDDTGIIYFAAWEYLIPNNPQVAADCGYTLLLPSRDWWPKAAALGLLADQLRSLVNEPVQLRNWWRPDCYNTGVGGAAGGDHPDADALDLDFASERSRADAQRYLCDTYWNQDFLAPEEIAPGSNVDPRLNVSVGLGGVTIHAGVLSSNGRRFWKYDSYTTLSNSGTCW